MNCVEYKYKFSLKSHLELWTVTQAAKELGVARSTIYKMYERRDLLGIADAGLKIVPKKSTKVKIAYLN